ncbi:MAG: hypothetical protein LBS98_04105 [Coriobacteriales bacterium]|jgi:hypothetical protein|nr:hypothetical protein [Coriobacteriales bacterium]
MKKRLVLSVVTVMAVVAMSLAFTGCHRGSGGTTTGGAEETVTNAALSALGL